MLEKRCALVTMSLEFSLYHSVGVVVGVYFYCVGADGLCFIDTFIIHNTVERRSCHRDLSLITR